MTMPVKLTFLGEDQVIKFLYNSNLNIYHCNTFKTFIIQYLYGQFLTRFVVYLQQQHSSYFFCSYAIVAHAVFHILPCTYKKHESDFLCFRDYFKNYFIHTYKNKRKSLCDFNICFKCKMNQLVQLHVLKTASQKSLLHNSIYLYNQV